MDVAVERSSSCRWKGAKVNKLPWLASLTTVAALGVYVAQRERTALRLRQAAAVFDHTREAIIITDARQRIVAVNPAFTAISGYSADEVLGRNPSLQHSGRQDQAFYRQLWAELNETGQWQGEIWNRRKSGEVYAAWENISAVRGRDGSVEQYVAVLARVRHRVRGDRTARRGRAAGEEDRRGPAAADGAGAARGEGSASVGIALYPDDGATADAAMYRAKAQREVAPDLAQGAAEQRA